MRLEVGRFWSWGLAVVLGAGLLQACLNPRPEDFPSSGDDATEPSDVDGEGPVAEEPNSPLVPPGAPGAGGNFDSPDAGAPADAGAPDDAGGPCSAGDPPDGGDPSVP